jgi:hypothetical protein
VILDASIMTFSHLTMAGLDPAIQPLDGRLKAAHGGRFMSSRRSSS